MNKVQEKLTQERSKEFWEWCGIPYGGYGNPSRQISRNLPPIDYNNLFKHGMPKVKEKLGRMGLFHLLQKWAEEITSRDIDPVLALFWAFWQAKEVKL